MKCQALLDKVALEKERASLAKENEDLKAILKKYLDGISVNDEVLNRANPLLIVNGRVADTIRVTTNNENVTNTSSHVVVINQYAH